MFDPGHPGAALHGFDTRTSIWGARVKPVHDSGAAQLVVSSGGEAA
jgi:hypothetical protein